MPLPWTRSNKSVSFLLWGPQSRREEPERALPCDVPWLPSGSIFLVNSGAKKIWFGSDSHQSYASVKHSQFLLPKPKGKNWMILYCQTILLCKTRQLHPKCWLGTLGFTILDRAAGNQPGSLLWQVMAKPGVLWQSHPDASEP